MKNNYVLVDPKNGYYVTSISSTYTTTWNTIDNAIIFNCTEEWINGYVACLEQMFKEIYKPTLI